ncbi:MAG: toxin higB-2 [Pseudomonadota bacterium]|jgi:hypothetical protein
MRPVTIVETAPFIRATAPLLSDEERLALIDHLARNPTAGAVIPDTGGARKLRWGRGASGKSGGIRTIYYFHDPDFPLFLLTAYGKGSKANLTAAERSSIREAIGRLKQKILVSRARGLAGQAS